MIWNPACDFPIQKYCFLSLGIFSRLKFHKRSQTEHFTKCSFVKFHNDCCQLDRQLIANKNLHPVTTWLTFLQTHQHKLVIVSLASFLFHGHNTASPFWSLRHKADGWWQVIAKTLIMYSVWLALQSLDASPAPCRMARHPYCETANPNLGIKSRLLLWV